ncbi:MAG: sigma-70 family RNA polymerase sigma factor [Deltaproteobacteria bacterium]|nr:sigma-70 family RNA polymerase sigma factor [Deltaproteobacteria bacterium]
MSNWWDGMAGDDKHIFSVGSLETYLSDIRHIPLLDEAEEVALARLVQKGDSKARSKMIRANLRLVVHLVRHYQNRGLPTEDLIEEGNLGLIRAVERFDPEFNCRFSTYAVWWIRQYMSRALISQSKIIRLPVHVVDEFNTYIKGRQQFINEQGREPTFAEVSEYIEHEFTSFTPALERLNNIISLTSGNNMEGDGEGDGGGVGTLSLEQLPDDRNDDPLDIIGHELRLKIILCWLDELSSKERLVITRRFGLLGEDPLTLEEIGQQVHLTRERIRQLEKAALHRLKKIVDSYGYSLEDLL